MLIGRYAGRLCHAGALLVMCAMLASCSVFAPNKYEDQQRQKDISMWKAAGSPPVVKCSYPFEIETPVASGNMGSQSYASMRDFSQAAAAAQAPVWECGIIGGNDTELDVAQIAKAKWGRLGYVLLHTWHPGTAFAYYYVGGGSYVMNPPPAGSVDDNYYVNPSYSYVDDTARYFDEVSAAYGAWYLAYQRIPKDNVQATRQGIGLYAMQGFRCAIHMRDFPAARRYWALALSTNPESVTVYAKVGLQSLFQVHFQKNSGSDFLNIPQDIRSTVWDAAGQSYSRSGSKLLSMTQVENAAQTGALDKILLGQVPKLSVLYCPVFYPDFDPVPLTPARKRTLFIGFYDLREATERAVKQAGETGKK